MSEKKPMNRILRPFILAALSLGVLATSGFAEEAQLGGSARGRGKDVPALDPAREVPLTSKKGSLEHSAAFPRESVFTEERLPESRPGGTLPGRERTALAQPGCSVCLSGAASVQWTGSSGSFHVDTVSNNQSFGTSGPLELKVVLSSASPVYGQTLNYYDFSDVRSLSPLAAGYHYSNVNSGTVAIFESTIPVGEYWQLLYLREYSGGTWYYADWIVMDKKVSCNGVNCSVVTAPPPPAACTEDAFTMCLVNGRYKVTSRWKNQYAGGAEATLSKAKLTDTTGAYWLSDPGTYEYMIRFNTATDNGKVWIAILTFTSVEFWVDVTDTKSGQFKEYHSDPGNTTLIYDPYYFVYP